MEAEGVAGKAGGNVQTLRIPKAPQGYVGRRGELGSMVGGSIKFLTWGTLPLPHRWGSQPLHLQGQPLLGGVSEWQCQ